MTGKAFLEVNSSIWNVIPDIQKGCLLVCFGEVWGKGYGGWAGLSFILGKAIYPWEGGGALVQAG